MLNTFDQLFQRHTTKFGDVNCACTGPNIAYIREFPQVQILEGKPMKEDGR